ncbi:MAG: hypothetical protein ACERKD_08980 [Prolixibacteraceae bacterium]
MRTTIKYILTFAIGIFMLASCEQEDILFNESMSAVGFYKTKANVSEINASKTGGGEVVVTFLVTALTNSPSCEITFTVDTEGIANPAAEGVDFETIQNKTVTISEGYGYFPITIKALNNDQYDVKGNKSFKLTITGNSLGYDLASASSILVTIVDDDHPLGWLFGDYAVATPETANGSTEHPGMITAVENEPTKIKLYGMAGSTYGPALVDPYFIIGTVNEEQTTVSIATGQTWESWDWGSVELNAWEDDNGEGAETNKLIGTIEKSDDGKVSVTFNQQFTFMITDGGNEGLGLQWAWNSDDAPNSATSIWTKQ